MEQADAQFNFVLAQVRTQFIENVISNYIFLTILACSMAGYF